MIAFFLVFADVVAVTAGFFRFTCRSQEHWFGFPWGVVVLARSGATRPFWIVRGFCLNHLPEVRHAHKLVRLKQVELGFMLDGAALWTSD